MSNSNPMNSPMFEGRPLARPHEDVEDQGLVFDMQTVLSRRRLLGALGIGAGAAALAACTPSGTSTSTSAASSSTTTSASKAAQAALKEMNSETAGPYPGDGSNGPDVLDETGIERRDLTKSVDGNGSVTGTPMTLVMNLIDISNNNAPLTGAAIYAWHCNGKGEYSMYSDGVTDQTWLRGVQVTDANGKVTFDSIIPGCYPGHWPHIHFEVFKSINDITDATNNVLTSQIAIPEDVARAVYTQDTYGDSVSNLNQLSLATDNIFSDGWDAQMPTVTGDATSGYTLTIDVPVDPTTKSQASSGGPGGGGPGGGPGGTPPAGGPGGTPPSGGPGGGPGGTPPTGAPPAGAPPTGTPPTN